MRLKLNLSESSSAIIDAAALAWPIPVVTWHTPASLQATAGWSAARPGTGINCVRPRWVTQAAASPANALMIMTLTGIAPLGVVPVVAACAAALLLARKNTAMAMTAITTVIRTSFPCFFTTALPGPALDRIAGVGIG